MKNRALRRSLSDFARHPWLHFVSISTISVALVILGAFFICFRNFEYLSERTTPDVTGTAYLAEGLEKDEVQQLSVALQGYTGVQKVVHKSKTQVLSELEVFLGDEGEGLPGGDLFPDVLEITLSDTLSTQQVETLRAQIAEFPEVKEVDFSQDWMAQYKSLKSFFTLLGLILVVGIIVGCTLITANFMGIRHQARREEISIVRLIGGNNRFIMAPFIIEGLLEGLIGTVVALSILYAGKEVLTTLLTVKWATFLGGQEWLFLSPLQLAMIAGIGVAMASLGGLMVFLRFQEDAQ